MTKVTEPDSKSPAKPERTPPTVEKFHDEENAVTMTVSGDVWRIFDAAGGEEMGGTLLEQIVQVGSQGRTFDDKAANFIVGFVDNMHPNDPAEALLLTQMGATHQAAMMMARRLNHVKEIPQQDSAERALNKLLRTFTSQMEALRKYRNGGKQTVTVQHVHVEDGGQAIVGNVKTGGSGHEKK